MRSGDSYSSSSSSDNSSEGPRNNNDDLEDEKHAWKRKKPSVKRKSNRKTSKVASAVAKSPRRGKFSKDVTASHPQSSTASPPAKSKQGDSIREGSKVDEPSGRKSFLRCVIDNYRKSARIRQNAAGNSEKLPTETVDSSGDKNSVDVSDDISSASANDVKKQCSEVKDIANKSTNDGVTSAAEAETVDRLIDAKVDFVASEDVVALSVAVDGGLEEDRSQSNSEDEMEMDSSDVMHKSKLGESADDIVKQVPAESSSNDEDLLSQSEGVLVDDEKKMELLDDSEKNEIPGSFDEKNGKEKSDLSPRGGTELEEPSLASVDSVDTTVGIANDALNESKEINNKNSVENLRLNSNNGELDTLSAEKNLSLNEENATNDMHDKVKECADSDIAKYDLRKGIENKCDMLHEALQQIIPANTSSNEVLITAQKHGGYNLRQKKNVETTIFVSNFGGEDDDDTESDDSIPNTRSNRNRSNSSSFHNGMRGRRERGASMLYTICMNTDKAACASEKPENPFFKHFSTIDQWFTSKEGKKNHPFRKCICIYCEEQYKDGLQAEPPKPVLKKSRPCRVHLDHCVAYQLYLQKTGKKSVTETSEFGLKEHEIERLRARLKANAAGVAALSGEVGNLKPDISRSIGEGETANKRDENDGSIEYDVNNINDNNNSSRRRGSARLVIKNGVGGIDDDKESVDELERRIQLRMKEEAENVLSLTKRPKTLHHAFYDHFRFFDDSQVHIRQGVPSANLRGYCIHCEEQYNAGITDRKPDFVSKRARNCRSHLDNCKHYKVFLASTGLSSVTKETLVGLEKKRRNKVVEEMKRVGKEPPPVLRGSNRVKDINKEILEREASNGIQHNLLLSPFSDYERSRLLGRNKNHANEIESEAVKGLRSVFEEIIPLAEVDPELCTIAVQQMRETLLNLRNTIANKKRKLEELEVALVRSNNDTTSTAATTTHNKGAGTTVRSSRSKSISRKKSRK